MMIFQPHEYQKQAIDLLINNNNYALFLDMGLGKTIITLSAIAEIGGRTLVIAPKTVAQSTWQDEAARWEHTRHLTFATVLGAPAKRLRALKSDADVFVINRENVVWLCQTPYIARFDNLVIDESTSFKSPTSKRFRALKRHLQAFKRRYILTGTPAPNSYLDLWAQFYCCDMGESLGKTFTAYRFKNFKPDKRNGYVVYSWKILDGAEKRIQDAVAPRCMSLQNAVSLPECVSNLLPVKLPKNVERAYKGLLAEYTAEYEGNELTAVSAGVLANKLCQVASGNMYIDDGAIIHMHDAKLEKLKELYDTYETMLVFYIYKSDLNDIMGTFHDAEILDGPDTMRRWNDGKIKMLLAHPASCAYGLNLQQGGHVVVWYTLTWSLELYQQANARLHRQGQINTVVINHIIAKNTIDERIYDVLQNKGNRQQAFLDAVKAEIGGV